MRDKKQNIGLMLQGLWILIFLLAALLLEGKLRALALLCACACGYTLVHSLIRARAEKKLSEGNAAAGENSDPAGENG